MSGNVARFTITRWLQVFSVVAIVASSARLRTVLHDLASNHDSNAADPSAIGAMLHARAQVRSADPNSEDVQPTVSTPFQCASHIKDVSILAEKPLVLKNLGKLAKGGNFLVSEDLGWLVKAIEAYEATVLAGWIEEDIVQEHYGGCEGFEKSLLLPVPLTFSDSKPYIVMGNETQRLQHIAGSHWQVQRPYDIKPLPNLSKGLIQILMSLMDGWGKGLAQLKDWLGWDNVRALLERDLGALTEANVVDYSFFVHVILPDASASMPPPELVSTNGCIKEPTSKAIVCFRIIDFMTAFTTVRHLESSFKGDKFDDYAGKVMHAFDCVGNLASGDCQSYEEYVRIKAASNKAEAKVAFVGTSTFRDHYECKLDEPYLRYEDRADYDYNVLWSYMRGGQLDEVSSYDPDAGDGYDRSLAGYLQNLVSLDEGAEIVRDEFRDYMDLSYDSTKQYQCLEENSTVQASDAMAACKRGVYNFATVSSGILTTQHINQDLGNVLWNPELKSIVVVRGAPQFARWFNSHGGIVTEMLRKYCVMKTRMFHCRQIPGEQFQYDYKVNFKDLEMLQVFPGHYRDDEFKLL